MSNMNTSSVDSSKDQTLSSPLHLVSDNETSQPLNRHDARQRLEEKLADLALEKDVREFDFDI